MLPIHSKPVDSLLSSNLRSKGFNRARRIKPSVGIRKAIQKLSTNPPYLKNIVVQPRVFKKHFYLNKNSQKSKSKNSYQTSLLFTSVLHESLSCLYYESKKSSDHSITKVRKGDQIEITEKDCNLSEYPTVKECLLDENCQITIGDLHGNALKLFYFLIRHGVIDTSKDDYEKFIEIYQKDIEKITIEDLNEFNDLLKKAKYIAPANGSLIRLIGDELADRGNNDYFILKILEKLFDHKIPFEIIFSNHGYEFISVYEKGILNNQSFLEKFEGGFAESLTNLRKLIEKKLVTLEELDYLVTKIYQPSLKLLSYYYKPNIQGIKQIPQITIFTHAPVGLKTIESLALLEMFGKSYNDENIKAFISTIEKTNNNFSDLLRQKILYKTFPELSKSESSDISLTNPLKRIIWSRNHQEIDIPIHSLPQFEIFYVHGHAGSGEVDEKYKSYITNLDNELGKSFLIEKNTYSIVYSC